jgi:hypothetical protein
MVEIGSHKGTSLALMASALVSESGLGNCSAAQGCTLQDSASLKLRSIDPYLPFIVYVPDMSEVDKVLEVSEELKVLTAVQKLCSAGKLRSSGPACKAAEVEYEGGCFMTAAFALYELMGISDSFSLDRSYSNAGLARVLAEMGFGSADITHVDGQHLGIIPVMDAIFALAITRPGGVVVLDDWTCDDIVPFKTMFDECFVKVSESWKTAAYAIPA